MIIDQTYGAIQQQPTALGLAVWTWSIIPGASVVVVPEYPVGVIPSAFVSGTQNAQGYAGQSQLSAYASGTQNAQGQSENT